MRRSQPTRSLHLPRSAPRHAPNAFIAELDALIRQLGMQSRLRDVGIPQDALRRMALDAMKQTRLLVNNPRPVTEDDAFAIYSEAW
jgi:alcohol dehydrogenase class IV